MKPTKNAVEWSVFGFSVIVIGIAVALLVDDALSSAGKRPDLHVETGAPVRSSDGYMVPVVVSNRGDETAEQARIKIALTLDGEAVESAELTIAFVPRKSERQGSVVFRRDPRCCVVAASTVAYEKP